MSEHYFHGGQPGLRVGQSILPTSVTGAASIYDGFPHLEEEASYRRDRVYLVTKMKDAIPYAALFPTHGSQGGDIYRVEPVGMVELDPDWLGEPGGSVTASSAVIIGIMRTGVPRKSFGVLL